MKRIFDSIFFELFWLILLFCSIAVFAIYYDLAKLQIDIGVHNSQLFIVLGILIGLYVSQFMVLLNRLDRIPFLRLIRKIRKVVKL